MSFDSKYKKLTGHEKPLSWQKRLYDEYLSKGQIPDQLDLPTGLGKTSVMALWLIARAEGINLPRRLVYIVDRRAVVDQATHFAEQLRENISNELACKLGLGDTKLPISTLRGAFADNKLWLENPATPAIIVGTIDMIGSRLLFEGYGVSRRMRPFHAGLLGVDSLFVLDEAHLCPPFESLLTTIDSGSSTFGSLSKDEKPNDPPLHFLSLSATPHRINSRLSQTVFSLNNTGDRDNVVRKRLSAKKLLKFYEVDNKEKIQKLAECSVEYGVSKKPARVLVYCNSRKDALKVKQEIDKQWKSRKKCEAISELMVGERRAYERMNLEIWLREKGFLTSKEGDSKTTAFLIATSAGEVGIDLDADHMVCDLVSWERMVQRLGRVNRRANCGHCAYIDVFSVNPEEPKNASSKKKEEYQSLVELNLALKEPFECLRSMGWEEDGRVKVSLDAILDLRSCKAILEKASTPSPLYPALTRPLLEAWSMTSLKEHSARPEVAPWLRGWTDEEPQTTVVWRKYLPKQQNETSEQTISKNMVSKFFTYAPIHSSERLEAETRVVLDWLLKRARNLEENFNNELACIVIDRAGEKVTERTFGKLANISKKLKEQLERELADATIVVDARLCGLSNGLLDEKSEIEVPTADFSQEWQDIESEKDHWMVEFRIEQLFSSEEDDEGLKVPDLDDQWKHIHTFETRFSKSGRVISGLAVFKWHDTTNDEDARSVLSHPQLLKDHSKQVLKCVRTIVHQLGLRDDEIEAFEKAAEFHDEGKNSELWQNAMNAPKDGNGPYAKTKGGGNLHLLRGYRHEFGSLVDVRERDLPRTTRDLIMHLIASHHGYARPIISSEGCDAAPPSALKPIAGEASLRFAQLQKHYGPWGLAWREALFRAADHMASRNWSSKRI